MEKLLVTKYKNNISFTLRGKEYFLFAAREGSFCREEAFLGWYIYNGTHSVINVPEGQVSHYYLETRTARRALKKLEKYILKNWHRHISSYPSRKNKLLRLSQNLSDSVKTNNNKVIASTYLKYFAESLDFCEYLEGAWTSIFFMEPELAKKIPEHMETIQAVGRPIEFVKMQRDLFRLSPAQLVERYAWLNVYSPNDKAYTRSDFVKFKKITKKKEIFKHIRQCKINERNFLELIKSMQDPELRAKAIAIHTYSFLKTDRVDAWKHSMFLLKPFFQYLRTMLPGSSLDEAVYLTSWEIKIILNGGDLPDRKNLVARSRHEALYFFNSNTITVINNKNTAKNVFKKLSTAGGKSKLLNGVTASKGIGKGLVKIIRSSADLKKIKKGDVFVAKYTFPTFTHAMAKCVAIVTDEGGITSHAAIVSREYHIPCIVGVQNATKVLKDGDLVEVDAGKGTVKVIKRR